MASLAASDANRVVVALPAGSASLVRIAGLAVLCAATLVAPALLLVWMPIVLGVPHVASDIRYLVLPLPRRQVALAIGACAVLVALKVAGLVAGISLLRAEAIVVATWLVVMLVFERPRRQHVLERHARHRPRALDGHASRWPVCASLTWLLVAGAGLAIVALPFQFAVVAAFAHNFVAVIAWLVVQRPARRHALAIITAIGAAVVVLLAVGPAVASMTGGDASPWLTIDGAASRMFAGVPAPTARALLIAFAFLQAVHYAIWLHWIPSGSAARMGTKPWLCVAATTLAVIAAALVDAAWARTTYLALATFHIYLELVVLGVRGARRYL